MILPQTITPETIKILTSVPKELWAIIFLLSGGLSFLIIREVFAFLKLTKKTNGKNGYGNPRQIIAPEEMRDHFVEAIRTDERLTVMAENVKILCTCQTNQTIILDRISQTESRLENAVTRLLDREQ